MRGMVSPEHTQLLSGDSYLCFSHVFFWRCRGLVVIWKSLADCAERMTCVHVENYSEIDKRWCVSYVAILLKVTAKISVAQMNV